MHHHPEFPLDRFYPLARASNFIKSSTNFIRKTWISFNNDASQVFETRTGILPTTAPDILDPMPTDSPWETMWSTSERIKQSAATSVQEAYDFGFGAGARSYVQMMAETDGQLIVTSLLILLLLLLLLLLYYCYCSRGKSVNNQTAKKARSKLEPETESESKTEIEIEEEIKILRKQLAQQEEECDEEKSELRHELEKVRKSNEILKSEALASTRTATTTDKDKLIDAQRLHILGQDTLREHERVRQANFKNKKATMQQDNAKLGQQIEQLQRELVEACRSVENSKNEASHVAAELTEAKRQRLIESAHCEKEKQSLRDEVKRAADGLLAQQQILAYIQQFTTKENESYRPKSEDKATQTLTDKQIHTIASVSTQTTISGGASTSAISSHTRPNAPDIARTIQLERENASIQNQNDSLRGDFARLRSEYEEHSRYQKSLEDMLESSKAVEQMIKEMDERCLCGRGQQEGMSPMSTPSPIPENGDLYSNPSAEGDIDRPICDITRCHNCPWYPGEKHHVCNHNFDNMFPSPAETEPIGGVGPEADKEDFPYSRVPALKTPPPIPFPEPSPLPIIPQIPSRPTSDAGEPTDLDLIWVKPSLTPEYEAVLQFAETLPGRRRLRKMRNDLRERLDKFEEDAKKPKCSGRLHKRVLEFAVDERSHQFKNTVGMVFKQDLDLDEVQKSCNDLLVRWAVQHEVNRKHWARKCSKDDIEKSEGCLPADTPELPPPSLPLPFQEAQLTAIAMYEAERVHEFIPLPTDGNGFLCGVSGVELTVANMHPEIDGLTAAALLEVLDWPEYRGIVDDTRFTYIDHKGQAITPTNRTFFSVDQLACMVGLWGSRRDLDLRLGVNRNDHGPSVYGGARVGTKVIIWIHHDNNEERSRDANYPGVNHFSGYRRVPADTEDESQTKKDAAGKARQEAEGKSQKGATPLPDGEVLPFTQKGSGFNVGQFSGASFF